MGEKKGLDRMGARNRYFSKRVAQFVSCPFYFAFSSHFATPSVFEGSCEMAWAKKRDWIELAEGSDFKKNQCRPIRFLSLLFRIFFSFRNSLRYSPQIADS